MTKDKDISNILKKLKFCLGCVKLLLIVYGGFFYAAGAFVEWNLFPSEWGDSTRLFTVIMWLIVSLVTTSFIVIGLYEERFGGHGE